MDFSTIEIISKKVRGGNAEIRRNLVSDVSTKYPRWIDMDLTWVPVGMQHSNCYSNVKNIALNMSGFWIFQESQYATFLYCQGYKKFRGWQVLKISRNGIMEEFRYSEYVRFLHMQLLHKVLNMPENIWILLGPA